MSSYSTYDDAALLLQLKQGDGHSDQLVFREIYDRYMEKLYRSACRKLTSPEQAEEIVHDVLLDLWRRRAELDIEHLQAYLEKGSALRSSTMSTGRNCPGLWKYSSRCYFLPKPRTAPLRMKRLINSWKAG